MQNVINKASAHHSAARKKQQSGCFQNRISQTPNKGLGGGGGRGDACCCLLAIQMGSTNDHNRTVAGCSLF